MKKVFLATLFTILLVSKVWAGTCWNGGSSGSSPWNVLNGPGGAPSLAYIDVNYCLNTVAAENDTIYLPAGSAVWTSALAITKSINIVGQTTGCPNACNDGTVITSGGNNNLITVTVSGDKTIRISGLTLDGALGITKETVVVTNSDASYPLFNLRLHHNELRNIKGSKSAISLGGLIYSLVDSNFFNNNFRDVISYATYKAWYLYPATSNFGTINYLYIEDNISTGASVLTEMGNGVRYVYRYNTITTQVGPTPLDIHGDVTGQYGCVATEIYGNVSSAQSYNQFLDYRGGAAMVWGNRIKGPNTSEGYTKIRAEKQNPVTCTTPNNVTATTYCIGHEIMNGYIWSNIGLTSSTTALVLHNLTTDPYGILAEKTNWWDDYGNTPEYFTKDINANRLGTCTDGDVFWETDNKKLYRCIEANNWIFIYTPFTYPHPLSKPQPPFKLILN
jgi:hypothetical protein